MKILHALFLLSAFLLVLSAAIVGVARISLPLLTRYPAVVQYQLSTLFGEPVQFSELDATWQRWGPQIILKKARVGTGSRALNAKKIQFDFSIWRNIWNWTLLPNHISITDIKLEIQLKQDKTWHIRGLTEKIDTTRSTQVRHVLNRTNIDITQAEVTIQLPHRKLPQQQWQISLRNQPGEHHLKAQVKIPTEPGMAGQLGIDWQGEWWPIAIKNGDGYARVENITWEPWIKDLVQLLPQPEWARTWYIQELNGNISTTAHWKNGQITRVFTRMNLQALHLQKNKKTALELAQLSGNLQWQKTFSGFAVAGDNWQLTPKNARTPVPIFKFQWQHKNTQEKARDEFELSYLNLASALKWLQHWQLIPDSIKTWLDRIQPTGKFYQIKAQHTGPWSAWETWQINSEFSNVSTHAWQAIPGVKDLNGRIMGDPQAGFIEVAANKQRWKFLKTFSQDFALNELKGIINWHQTDAQWEIKTEKLQLRDDKIQAVLRGQVVIPKTDPTKTQVNITGNFSGSNIQTIKPYLPDKIMTKHLVAWLSHSISNVKKIQGDLTLRGEIIKFPFDQKEGLFEVQADTEQVKLKYAPGWDPLEKINAHVLFRNRLMVITGKSAIATGVQLSNIDVDIPTLGTKAPEILSARADAQGDLTHLLTFLQHSPFADAVTPLVKQFALTGAMSGKLKLRIPLAGVEKASTRGEITFDNAQLKSRQWPLTLSALAGTIHFTDKQLSSPSIRGIWNKQPVVMKITTRKKENKPVTRVQLATHINIPMLEKFSGVPLKQYTQGETPLTATVDLPAEGHGFQKVIFRSPLTGIQINLPSPLKKSAQQSQPVELTVLFAEPEGARIDINGGNFVQGELIFQTEKEALNFERGIVHFGKGKLPALTPRGLVVSLQLDQLSVSKWISLWEQQEKTIKKIPHILQALVIQFDELQLFGQRIRHAEVTAKPKPNAWDLALRSQEVRGNVLLPAQKGGSIRANLDYLYLRTLGKKQTQTLGPQEIPPLQAQIKDLRYNAQRLGTVNVSVSPQANGTRINALTMQTGGVKVESKGTWTGTTQQSLTRLQGKIYIQNLARALRDWNIAPALDSRSGQVNFALRWPQAPYNFKLSQVSGEVALRLRNGRIIELDEEAQRKIGLGKLLSILSLQTLPRRLTLDFSDLTQKGLSFDIIQGVFGLKHGNATTQDAYLEGPVARVDMQGRIGFTARDYDLKLRVMPHVTASLPVVAAIAGGPIVGAVAWVANKLISRGVSQVAGYTYHVKGPWHKPELREELHPASTTPEIHEERR